MKPEVNEKDVFRNLDKDERDGTFEDPGWKKRNILEAPNPTELKPIVVVPQMTKVVDDIPNTTIQIATEKSQAILIFDGGGVRGYYDVFSSLLVLRELMRYIEQLEMNRKRRNINNRERYQACWTIDTSLQGGSDILTKEQHLPCQYFDYIAGSSTGGLLATMLGRLRMSTDDCIKEYIRIGEIVFQYERNSSRRSKGPKQTKECIQNLLETTFNSIIERRMNMLPSNMRNHRFESPSPYCKTMVVVIKSDGPCEIPYIFRSYDHFQQDPLDPFERNPGPASTATIWQIARVTSAAPMYLKPFEWHGKKFLDSGFGINNPSIEAYFEVQKLHRQRSKPAILSVSIGSNNYKEQDYKRSDLKRWLSTFCSSPVEYDGSERVHHGMKHLQREAKTSYHRFNASASMRTFYSICSHHRQRSTHDVLSRIEKATSKYLSERKVEQGLQELAKVLVQHRRLPAQET